MSQAAVRSQTMGRSISSIRSFVVSPTHGRNLCRACVFVEHGHMIVTEGLVIEFSCPLYNGHEPLGG